MRYPLLLPLAAVPVLAMVLLRNGTTESGTAAAPTAAPGIDHISSSLLSAALDSTMKSGAKGVQFRLADDRNAQYLMNRRTAPSDIELHCHWDDLMVVRAGAGVVSTSRRVQGPVKYSWGEWRAARLVSAGETTIASGDVVRIPAGHAHQVRPLGDVPLVYLVVKVRSPDDGAVCGSLERAVGNATTAARTPASGR